MMAITAAEAGLVGCHTCGLLAVPPATAHHPVCARCGTSLHLRKPDSIGRTWAFLIAACVLYIRSPACSQRTLRNPSARVRSSPIPRTQAGKPTIEYWWTSSVFESVLGQAVAIDALWTVRRASNRDSKTGRSVAGEPTAGAGHDALVTAHGRALVAVSRDIADAIRAMERMPR